MGVQETNVTVKLQAVNAWMPFKIIFVPAVREHMENFVNIVSKESGSLMIALYEDHV